MADDRRPVTASKPTNDIAGQVAERVRTGDNVLIALSKDPSVDELSAAIGLTFLLDKMGKHATAIFSGAVPNAIEFLEPEKTFETNTNSLQDFIIALDKDKADHLRYKIDGDYVKVYITPYKTTIDEGDLEFSHGDFNVDLIIALAVSSTEDLDRALAEHGRIMHDASSINIGTEAPGRFGDLQWSDPAASSVSEMICGLAERLKENEPLMDKPIATALLAGIVAATNRFSNERTTPGTMSVASRLMEAGADQQLISSSIPVEGMMQVADEDTGMPVEEPVEEVEAPKVEEKPEVEPEVVVEPEPEPVDPSMLQIAREESEAPKAVAAPEVAAVPEAPKIEAVPKVEIVPEVVEAPKVEAVPEMPKVEPVETPKVEEVPVVEAPAEETPEQQLEKIVQAPVATESASPLMNELREAAAGKQETLEPEHEEKVIEPLGLGERGPQKDYASLMEQELGVTKNAAAQAAPGVPSTVEINGIPTIDYGQAADSGQAIAAPSMNTEVAPSVEPVQGAQVAAPVEAAPVAPVVEVAAPLPVAAPVAPAVVPSAPAATPSATPLPMPDVSSEFLPPPPPPFDPAAPMGAVDFSPSPAPVAAPVQPVAPIAPAAPEPAQEGERSYLGSTPVMQDQVYPQKDSDPGAFQLPTPSV